MPNQYTTRLNHLGQKFGKLLVIAIHSVHPKKGTQWLCLCDCGNTCTPNGHSLRNGTSQSCGCARKERFTSRSHGASNTRAYQSWLGMKQRIFNPQHTAFKNYGGRGITICDQWIHSFETFLADMGVCPQGHTLERRNNEGDYTPENCEWANRKTQQRNRRNNRLITAFGETKPLAVWAEQFHLRYNVITYRLDRGYSPEDAVSLPPFSRYIKRLIPSPVAPIIVE